MDAGDVNWSFMLNNLETPSDPAMHKCKLLYITWQSILTTAVNNYPPYMHTIISQAWLTKRYL